MRLAYLCCDRGVPVEGTKGAAIHLRAMAGALSARGHDLTVLAARCGEPPAGFGPRCVDIGFDRTFKDIKRAIERPGRRQLAREVHSMLLGSRALEELEALDGRAPLDAVYERYSLWSWAGLRFARRRRVPLVLEVNAPLVDEERRWRRLELEPAARAIEVELLRGADAVVVPAAELGDWLVDEVGRGGPIHVVPNGFDEELFAEPGEPPPPARPLADRFVVAFVGSLKPWHGVEPLLEAFEALLRRRPAAHLLVLGDGPLASRVEEARQRLGEANVTLAGAVDHSQVPGWLAAADVGVAPYPALEPFYFSPLKVVEYQAAGLPVVASRIGQLRQLVDDGRNGLLVAPGDPAALTAALERLAARPEEARRMGRRARRDAFRRRSWRAAAATVEGVLERCRRRRGRRSLALASGGGR